MNKDTPLLASNFALDFMTSPNWFRTIRQLITTSSTLCGFDERIAGQITMAVDEALCNIHRHGYHGTSGAVTLRVTTSHTPSTTIEICIEDEAKQVDVNNIKSRNLEDLRPGGLGVHLIKTIMDEVNWSKSDTGGMKLTMRKTNKTNSNCNSIIESNVNE